MFSKILGFLKTIIVKRLLATLRFTKLVKVLCALQCKSPTTFKERNFIPFYRRIVFFQEAVEAHYVRVFYADS